MQCKALRLLVIAAMAACLAACDTTSALKSANSVGAIKAEANEPMKLQSGDKIRVTVFGEEKLSGEFDIDPNGFVSLPLAGTMKAAGQAKIDLEKAVAEKLKANFLKNPRVTVDVASYKPFYVLGEVQRPGEYPYKSGLNVVSAMAVAGGSTYRASATHVMIQRSGETELKEHILDPSVMIRPGDVVRVPERYF